MGKWGNGGNGETGKNGEKRGKKWGMGMGMDIGPPKIPHPHFPQMGKWGGMGEGSRKWGWGWGDLYPSPFPKRLCLGLLCLKIIRL
jgi:hypothetical protein